MHFQFTSITVLQFLKTFLVCLLLVSVDAFTDAY